LAASILTLGVMAAEHHGTVTANGMPVPGAVISATKGDKKVVTTSDDKGFYRFPNLEDGVWKIEVEMLGFATQSKEIGVMAEAPSPQWELKLQTLDQIRAALAPKPAVAATTEATATIPELKPSEAPKAAPTQSAAAPQGGGNGRGGNNGGRPSIVASQQGRGQQGRGQGGQPGRGQQGNGFQRLDVNQSGDLAAAGNEGAISNETASDLSQSASDSFLVNGSVSSGIGMPQGPPDWMMGGGRGGMDGFGPGMGMGLMGPNGDGVNTNGDGANQQAMGGRGGPGGGGPGGGRGGFGGPGGGGPGGFMGGGGPGGFGGRGGPGGFGGRGGRGGEGRGPGGGRPGFAAFGNARRDRRMQYNGNVAFNLDNSVWDAQSYSVTGNQVPKPAAARASANVTFGGPLKIPHLLTGQRGMFTINYAVNRSRNGTTQTATVPTLLERSGDFSQSYTTGPVTIYDPNTNAPFPGNLIPQNRLNPISLKLLSYYPKPNFYGNNRNYSAPIVSTNNSQNLNTRLNQTLNTKNRINGGVGYTTGSGGGPNLFGFVDNRQSSGINANVSWAHNFTTRIINNLNYRYSRARNTSVPYFSSRENVEGELGISGVSALPVNWGPPGLSFTQGMLGLSDGAAVISRNQTSAVGDSVIWIHNTHNMTFGADFRRQQINPLSDSNARGTFTFTGSLTSQYSNGVAVQGTGFDFADFLLGSPGTSSVNFGNADKYFRTSAYDVYLNDDWRVSTKLSLNGGIRWDYQSPISELYNRLVNLDIAPGYAAIQPVLAGQTGPLTGYQYPNSLVNPQKHNISPRIGFAWRPFPKHSTRINGGYGLYYNTAAYTGIANNLAAQPPFAQNFSVASTPAAPLVISNFSAGVNTITNTRAIDPFYRIGYAQIWQLSLQNDLGRALVGTLTFNHTKGTHLDQQFLPNSLPPNARGAATGPAGYIYEQSNGNSTFNSAQAGLMRRFRNGISGNITYMWSKAIDDGGIGTLIAQNWLNLTAERALSSFDRRHTMNANWQYSSGQGSRGGALINGWKGVLVRGWTFQNGITVQTGSPLTVMAGGNRSVVGGTGVTGPVRADATGAPLFFNNVGYGFNIHAFAAPQAGQWGTAGRDTIPGPTIFSLNGSMNRNFRIGERRNLDLSFRVNNALNHVTITNWGTTLSSATFGLPTSAAAMRSMTAQLRFRF
jgi:hypothetical protein